MKLRLLILILIVIIIYFCSSGCKDTNQAQAQSAETGFKLEVFDLPTGVAVRVDGVEITEQQVTKEMEPMLVQLNRDYADREQDGEYIHSKRIIRGRAIERLVTLSLVGREMKKHNIVVTQEQIDKHIEDSAIANGMTLDELKVLVTSRDKLTFQQWKEHSQYDKRLGVLELVESQNPDDLNVTEAEALEFYRKHYNLFERPERVQASHILIRSTESIPESNPNLTEAEAREKAEQLLEEIKNGADFAKLAKEHSDCPSGLKGGDLGYASKRSWVPQFAEAAFALQTGRVSDVVKTQFGYHIIKVTGRKEADVTSFEEAKEKIIEKLNSNKMGCLRVKYIESIVNNAKIEYAPGNLITMTPLLSL